MKISQTVFELLPGHEIMTDGRTDKVILIGPPPTSSGGALNMLNRDTEEITHTHAHTHTHKHTHSTLLHRKK